MKKYILLFVLIYLQVSLLNAQNFKFGKVSKEELEEKVHPLESDADAAILYRKFRTTFNYTNDKGFFGTVETKERIKIYNKDNDDWTTISVFLYKGENGDEVMSGLKAYTYNYDGSIKKIKLDKKEVYEEEISETYTKVTFTMPNIKNGSVIEYEYKIGTPFINSFDKFYFQEAIPVNKVEMTFAAPEYLEYKTHRNGWQPFTVDQSTKNRKLTLRYRKEAEGLNREAENVNATIDLLDNIYSVSLEKVPSLIEEPYSGNINNYRSTLQFELSSTHFPNQPPEFFTATWGDVAKRIYNSSSFGDQLRRKRYYKDDIDQLVDGLSKNEAIIHIYEYVKSKMTWDGSYGIYVNSGLENAYKDRKGNIAEINLLLVSMLKYAGIDASPVILGTKSNGVFLFPTRSGFNAVIAGVEIEGKLMFLDASDKMSNPNILNPELLNWFGGRLLKEGGVSKKINLLGVKAFHDALVNVKIDDEGAPVASVENRYSNNKAYDMRKRIYGKDNSSATTIVSSAFKDYEIYDLKTEEVNNVYEPLKVSFAAEVEDYFEDIGSKLYINPLLFLGMDTNIFKAEERKLPIDYDYAQASRLSFNIALPEGFQVESLPKPLTVNLKDNIGSYKYLISQSANGITISVQRFINKSFISANNYNDLKSFYEMIVTKEAEKIVLSKI